MKNIKFLALIMALLMVATALVGCGKTLTVEDVKADPMSYVADGLELTFDKTPLADFFAEGDYNGISAVITAPDFYTEGGVVVDEENAKGMFDFVAGVSKEEANIGGEVHYGDKKLIVKSDLLTQLLGTDSIGIDFGMTLDQIKDSDLYAVLVALSGMEKEALDKELDKIISMIDVEAAEKLIVEYFESLQKLAEESIKDPEVAEETLTYGEEEIAAIVVTVKQDSSYMKSVMEETAKLIKSFVKLAGDYAEGFVSEADIDAVISEIKLPTTNSTIKYYIAAKSSAVVKMAVESKIEAEGEDTVDYDLTIDFGAHPESTFLPKIEMNMAQGEGTLSLKGESKIEDAKFIFDATIKGDGEDEEITAQFVLENEKTFTATAEYGEEKFTVKGEFITEENGRTIKVEIIDPEDGKTVVASAEITVAAGVEVPAAPEYKNIFDFNEEDLSGIIGMLMMGGYEDYESVGDEYADMGDGEMLDDGFEIVIGEDGGVDWDGDGVIDEYIDIGDIELDEGV